MTGHSYNHDRQLPRQAMIDSQLRPQGVTDGAVLAAMGSVARERFVPEAARAMAYSDRSVALGGGRFLPPPAVLGRLLEALGPQAGERALLVGAGSGYSSAVLAAIGVDVTALDSDPALVAAASGAGVTAIDGPLDHGHKAGAPYDLVLIDGAVDHIPDALVDQLADGGRLAGALIERGVTRLVVGRKTDGRFGQRSIGDAGVAPLPGFQRPVAFTF